MAQIPLATPMVYYLSSLNIILLQPLRWCCFDCVIHHERDVREEQKYPVLFAAHVVS